MNRIVYPASALAAGLAISQTLFFLLVYKSNLRLHDVLISMEAAGFLVVPNTHVMPTLAGIPAAFHGALFFTFTIGAGLCLLSMAAAWVFVRIFRGDRRFFFFLIFSWLLSIAIVNIDVFTLAGTASLTIIPVFVFLFSIRLMPVQPLGPGWLVLALQITVILVVALAWMPKTDRDVFIDIRDNLLLSNTAGKAINDYYYRYTLYPAKLLKTPHQKLMASVCTIGFGDESLLYRLEDRLASYDYLPVGRNNGRCDLTIVYKNGMLNFSDSGRTQLQTTPESFFKATGKTLRDFSAMTDSESAFRTLTFLSLFGALPLTLFILVHGFFAALLFIIPSIFLRHAAASILCLFIGIGLVIPLYLIPDHSLSSEKDIRSALSSNDWRRQSSALRKILNSEMDPMVSQVDDLMGLKADEPFVSSPHVPVRYWYASALGNSRHSEAYEILVEMTGDPHPNVACMAYSSLGRFGNKQAVDLIKNRIAVSSHWYVQWYAYRALRQLGWTQTISDTGRALLP